MHIITYIFCARFLHILPVFVFWLIMPPRSLPETRSLTSQKKRRREPVYCLVICADVGLGYRDTLSNCCVFKSTTLDCIFKYVCFHYRIHRLRVDRGENVAISLRFQMKMHLKRHLCNQSLRPALQISFNQCWKYCYKLD